MFFCCCFFTLLISTLALSVYTSAAPVQKCAGPIAWAQVLLLAAFSRTTDPNDFTLRVCVCVYLQGPGPTHRGVIFSLAGCQPAPPLYEALIFPAILGQLLPRQRHSRRPPVGDQRYQRQLCGPHGLWCVHSSVLPYHTQPSHTHGVHIQGPK